MYIHPTRDKAVAKHHPELTAHQKTFGFMVKVDDYKRFLEEAETAIPHADEELKHAWAVYNAQHHPSCKAPVPQNQVAPKCNHYIWTIIQIVIMLILFGILAFRAHGQSMPLPSNQPFLNRVARFAGMPQIYGGAFPTYQNAGVSMGNALTGYYTFNCSTNVTCSRMGNVITLTASAAPAGSCIVPGTVNRLLYDSVTGCSDLGSLGTTTTVMHGNAAGLPTFAAVVSADLNITTTTCSNQFLTAISATGTGTCTTGTLASAQYANQGTTVTVLHGNGAGNLLFSAVALATDVSGQLPISAVGSAGLSASGCTAIASTGAITSTTCTVTIASGTSALATGAITSATCATVVTTSATGTATTDNIMADFNADPTGVTGYAPSASGMLTIIKYPTSNNVNFKVCNNTAGSITPGAITLNWRVVR